MSPEGDNIQKPDHKTLTEIVKRLEVVESNIPKRYYQRIVNKRVNKTAQSSEVDNEENNEAVAEDYTEPDNLD